MLDIRSINFPGQLEFASRLHDFIEDLDLVTLVPNDEGEEPGYKAALHGSRLALQQWDFMMDCWYLCLRNADGRDVEAPYTFASWILQDGDTMQELLEEKERRSIK